MKIGVITGYYEKAENLIKELISRGHEVMTFLRDYKFETYMNGIAPVVDKSIPGVAIIGYDTTLPQTNQLPKFDLLITDGTCKTRDQYAESCRILFDYPIEYAAKNEIRISSFHKIRLSLMLNNILGRFGIKFGNL